LVILACVQDGQAMQREINILRQCDSPFVVSYIASARKEKTIYVS
jgi:hypothetical protein